MSINKVRSVLYGTARLLGDVQAVSKAAATRSADPIVDRVLRREAGHLCSILLRALFK